MTNQATWGDGSLKKVYHGTTHAFDQFSLDHVGKNVGDELGICFTSNVETAMGYQEKHDHPCHQDSLQGQRIIEAYLTINKPIRLREIVKLDRYADVSETYSGHLIYDQYKNQLKPFIEDGYDGVIISDLHIVLDPKQITIIGDWTYNKRKIK